MAFGRSNSLSLNTGAANSLLYPASTGLFGAAPAAASQPQQSGGLFGASTATSQPQQSTGLFGAAPAAAQPAKPTLSLFGNNTATTSNTQPQQSGGLFGAATNNNNTTNTGGMFGSTQQNSAQTQNKPSLFGAPNATPSLLPMAGSLTMGQGNTQPTTQPGVKIDMSNLRPTTRFSDLHDDLKKQIEQIDAFIRQQESFATQCESMIGRHATDVESIKPDVDLIQNKIETVELALENDGAAIENAKELVQRDAGDLIRVARMAENLQLPQQYHYGRSSRPSTTDDEYDTDLVGYFSKQAEVMQKTLDTYTSHLAEIEAHLRVVEGSTVQQAHQLAAQRAGGRAGNSADNVRELAETLRGFESGILGAAGLVGSCREGVNELILGKIGGDPRESIGYGGRRSVRF
ncbi:uncharacterized protein M437DRAFT_58685 [Aureobasidium melanogenum CBS 110374]|uniref:Nucleoporin NUP49/NSP49 n=1 Tax=Aureobasidium melanogenum (strain CBS 110374) TaxID=1043003 RepID=A0A074VM14_AURM1|nr:uncharacterized protein M437DRAFT_58685 [Aureobasidium melanogenum CBS 110374]KEQ58712.1 hypothetical protein M437DRAFT_58685 [Aureobasidium melanogenum CBS 110374]